MLNINCYGILQVGARNFMTSAAPLCMKHYTSLGLTPKATHNEIKSAYYKLSMMYHPDKNKDDEAAEKFRAITEAYEILGNVKLKKMYDRGVLGNEFAVRANVRTRPGPTRPAREDIDPKMRFYEAHDQKHKIPTMDGSKPIYDFDTWRRSHYEGRYDGGLSRRGTSWTNSYTGPIMYTSYRSPRKYFFYSIMFTLAFVLAITVFILDVMSDLEYKRFDLQMKTDGTKAKDK